MRCVLSGCSCAAGGRSASHTFNGPKHRSSYRELWCHYVTERHNCAYDAGEIDWDTFKATVIEKAHRDWLPVDAHQTIWGEFEALRRMSRLRYDQWRQIAWLSPRRVVTRLVHDYTIGVISYDDLKAAIVPRTFAPLPYPLWFELEDLRNYGWDIPGTWNEFTTFYEDGTLTHEEWWGIAGDHPDWAGAKHGKPWICDPTQGFLEGPRDEITVDGKILVATGQDEQGNPFGLTVEVST